MHWTDQLHRSLIAISDHINRLDVDDRLLASSRVKLDRALFPLLARIALHPQISVAELANLVGRDHSTVSRQIIKLEELGLITRERDSTDQRVRHLAASTAGAAMVDRVRKVRRKWMEDHFKTWRAADRDRLIELMTRMMEAPTDEV